MANKGDRLKELVSDWREEAKNTGGRVGTSQVQDKERSDTLNECADKVEKIVNDHTKD